MAKYAAAVGGAPDAAKWEKLLGSNDWAGLLDPLDQDLREHLLRCGSFCMVTGESIIQYPQSKYYGESRYSPDDILSKIFFKQIKDYIIHKIDHDNNGFLYATEVVKEKVETNWMGFVAVSNDEFYQNYGRREIYVVWRGTVTTLEWWKDIEDVPVEFPGQSNVYVMKGFLDIYTTENKVKNKKSAQAQLKSLIVKYVDMYKDQKLSIVCTGHSLGGALAVLSAFDIASSGLLPKINGGDDIQVCAVSFEGPKVGKQSFKNALQKLKNTKVFHVNNQKDIVPSLPLEYPSTGTILHIDSQKSPFLKTPNQNYHSLTVVLHMVTGYTSQGEFDDKSAEVKKNLPLVNKWGSDLKDECGVIESWCVEKNKGMVYDSDKDEWSEGELAWKKKKK